MQRKPFSNPFFGLQNSKFLQFVSKMSRGELIIDDNQVKQTALPASGDWIAEYQQHYSAGPAWAGEFLNDKVCRSSNSLKTFFLALWVGSIHQSENLDFRK